MTNWEETPGRVMVEPTGLSHLPPTPVSFLSPLKSPYIWRSMVSYFWDSLLLYRSSVFRSSSHIWIYNKLLSKSILLLSMNFILQIHLVRAQGPMTLCKFCITLRFWHPNSWIKAPSTKRKLLLKTPHFLRIIILEKRLNTDENTQLLHLLMRIKMTREALRV